MRNLLLIFLLSISITAFTLETATKDWVLVANKGEYRVITPTDNGDYYTTMSAGIPQIRCIDGNSTKKDNPAIFLPAIEDVYFCQWVGSGGKYTITGQGIQAQ